MNEAEAQPGRFLEWLLRHKAHICFYVLVPLLIGYTVINRAFDGDGFWPIDAGDETAETFVQVPLAHAALAAGQILKINLYNNFGTPVLGEPVVYPFALHAVSYAIFTPVTAMLVNKFVLAALSMIAVTYFFARYFALWICSLCAFLVFSSPAFLNFFQNHPHQGTIFYFTLVLIALRRFFERGSFGRGICVYAAFLIFFFSVGINGALFGMAFTCAYAVLLGRDDLKKLLYAAGFAAAAAIAVHAHFLEFFRLAASSARKELNYQSLTDVHPLELIHNLVNYKDEPHPAKIFYSWLVMMLVIAGATWIVAELVRKLRGPEAARKDEAAENLKTELTHVSLLLGLLPWTFVLICRLCPQLPASLPLLKAMNISRLLWFADLFFILFVGHAATLITARARSRQLIFRMLWILFVCETVAVRYEIFFHESRVAALCDAAAVRFDPPAILPEMKPYTRLATLWDPVPVSQDTKAIQGHVLGSAGRSIILDKSFRDNLLQRGLIRMGYFGMTYYFRPGPPQLLARCGIRYCLANEQVEDLKKAGWVSKAESHDIHNRPVWTFFESPVQVTPFYSIDGNEMDFFQNYRIGFNDAEVELPPSEAAQNVIATFTARAGWKAFLNDEPIAITSSPEGFLNIHVEPQKTLRGIQAPAQHLLLKYEPYSDLYLMASVLASIAAAILVCSLLIHHPQSNG